MTTASSVGASAVYGPVCSWRFGTSLGVDLLLERSICSFDCRYCQLGGIELHTVERAVRVPTDRIARDLRGSAWRSADVVTFSGSGEPTLAANLGEAIDLVRAETGKPVVVLTNSVLLGDPGVQRELAFAAEVCCKLDAYDYGLLHHLNRPADTALTVREIVRRIASFRSGYRGRVSIQIMITPQTLRNIDRFIPWLAMIAADEVQLNVPSRAIPARRIVGARGEHDRFQAHLASRIASRASLEAAGQRLEEALAIRVLIPPVADPRPDAVRR